MVSTAPGKPRRIELDFVRGVAILAVMLFHFTDVDDPPHGWAGALFSFLHTGRYGVDLFFVLSGFLIGGLLLKEWKDTGRVNTKRFLLRRILKLWPAFYTLLIFHAVLRRHPFHSFFWQNAFHIQNYAGTSLFQTRTLAIEEHYYLLLTVAIALLAPRKASYRAVLVLCLAGSLISLLLRCGALYSDPDSFNPYWTQYRLDAPLLGVALAALFHDRPDVYRRLAARRWPLILACLGGLGWALWKPWESVAMSSIGFTIVALACCAFLVLLLEHSGRLRHWLPYRLIARLGIYAYGIFLWHSAIREPVSNAFPRLASNRTENWAWMVIVPCQLVLACLIGMVTTRIVEWPFLRWRESTPYLADRAPLLPPTELGDQTEHVNLGLAGANIDRD